MFFWWLCTFCGAQRTEHRAGRRRSEFRWSPLKPLPGARWAGTCMFVLCRCCWVWLEVCLFCVAAAGFGWNLYVYRRWWWRCIRVGLFSTFFFDRTIFWPDCFQLDLTGLLFFPDCFLTGLFSTGSDRTVIFSGQLGLAGPLRFCVGLFSTGSDRTVIFSGQLGLAGPLRFCVG
jgi:hypothetical protein